MVRLKWLLPYSAALVFLGVILTTLAAFAGWSPWVVLVGSVIAAVGGVWDAIGSERFQRDVCGLLTGGDSFCHLSLTNASAERNTVHVSFVHKGKYPMYDVQARVVDLAQFGKLPAEASLATILSHDLTVPLGTMVPGTASTMPNELKMGPTSVREFNVFLSARSGLFQQLLRCRKVGGAWVFATKVTRGREVLYEQVDPGYPRDERGEIDWSPSSAT